MYIKKINLWVLFLLATLNSWANINFYAVGRNLVESYPNLKLPSLSQLSREDLSQDKRFFSELPAILSRAERLEMHRENLFLESRFFEKMGLWGKDTESLEKLFRYIRFQVEGLIAYLKKSQSRPRPFAVISEFPEIEPTYTYSFPSLHSALATSYGLCLEKILGQNENLKRFTQSVGERRCRAGISFPSDVKAGEQLAIEIMPIIESQEPFQTLLSDVKSALKNEQIEIKEDSRRVEELGELNFKNEALERVLETLNLESEKPYRLACGRKILVTEKVPAGEWPIFLDVLCAQNDLEQVETESEILLTDKKERKNVKN